MRKRLSHSNLQATVTCKPQKNGASTTTGSKSSTAGSKIGTNTTENITGSTIGSKSISTAGENTGGTSTDRQAYCFLEGWWEKERRGPSASSQ